MHHSQISSVPRTPELVQESSLTRPSVRDPLFKDSPTTTQQRIQEIQSVLSDILAHLQKIRECALNASGGTAQIDSSKELNASSIVRFSRPLNLSVIQNMENFFRSCRNIFWGSFKEDQEKAKQLNKDVLVWKQNIKKHYTEDLDLEMQKLFGYASTILRNTKEYNLKMHQWRKCIYLLAAATLLFGQVPVHSSDSDLRRYSLKGGVWIGSAFSLISALYMKILEGEYYIKQVEAMRLLGNGIKSVREKADDYMILPVGTGK
jgi:hypothetical protein